MAWIINDLSLENTFKNSDEFIATLNELLKIKNKYPKLGQGLLCSRELNQIIVFNGLTFRECLGHGGKDLQRQVFSWLDKSGPFWSDERQENDDDYFHYNDIDVTDQGLGECARRQQAYKSVASFSVHPCFNQEVLTVKHGLADALLGEYSIKNIYTFEQLIESADISREKPNSWSKAIAEFHQQFSFLQFSDEIYKALQPLPFSIGIYEALCDRFNVLGRYLDSRDQHGRHTLTTERLLNDYFRGDKAWFSDESKTNINKFREKLSFNDLNTGEKQLFTFHGKIKNPQIRIHFQWPILPDTHRIQIVYIGPKLTKR